MGDEAFGGMEGRCAVVTGSSRGIGRAIACALACAGMNVCVNCSSEQGMEQAQKTADHISKEFGVDTIAVCADVSDSAQAQQLIDTVAATFGRIDVLVNNAGITRDGLTARMKDADFDDVIAVNLKGTFNCCRAVSMRMMKQRSGRIINVGSVVGLSGNAGQANYAASKAGVIGLSKSLAAELAPRNVTVNVIAPGFIQTDMTGALTEKQHEAAKEQIPLNRFGTPEDVAALARFFAGDDAGYITGQVVCVDGGMLL